MPKRTNDTPFERVVISDGGYDVAFSNKGDKKKQNICLPILNSKGLATRCQEKTCHFSTRAGSGRCPEHREIDHVKDWVGVLKPMESTPSHDVCITMLLEWAGKEIPRSANNPDYAFSSISEANENRLSIIDKFMADIMEMIEGKIPDATLLQENWLAHSISLVDTYRIGPDDVVELVKDMVEKHFPRNKFCRVLLKGKYGKVIYEDVPIRVVAALLMTGFACEEINRGDMFYAKANNKTAKNCGCMMAFGWYLYLRHTNMPIALVKKCLRG
jgi:hypothetical protein